MPRKATREGSTLRSLILGGGGSSDSGRDLYVGGADTGHLDFLKHLLPGYPVAGSTSGNVGTLVNNVLSLAQTTVNTVVDTIYLAEDLVIVGEELGTAFIHDM
jgi:hypothetical protein